MRARRWRPHFLRTSNGAELDLVLERGRQRRVYEIKLSKAPRVSRGFHELVGQAFEARPGIWVRPPLQASSAETI